MLADMELVFDPEPIERVVSVIRTAPETFREIALRVLIPQLVRRARELLAEPGEPHHPLRWTPSKHPEDQDKTPNTVFGYYSRQKAAYFATNGFGAGIPYTRTHQLALGWDVELRSDGESFALVLTHPSEIWVFVQGPWQQPYHYDTGWPIRADAAQVLSVEGNDLLLLVWHKTLFDELRP